MTIDAQNVDVKFTSFSYVAVWVRPIAIFPNFINDSEFCSNFFHENGGSIFGQISDGYSLVGPGASSYIIINNNRITISSSSAEETIKFFKKFIDKITEDVDYSPFAKVKAYGINFEFNFPLGRNAKEFITEKFSKSNNQQIENVEYSIPIRDNESLYVKLNSNKAESNYIYGSINHHHGIENAPVLINDTILNYNETLKLTKELVLNTLN